MFSLYAADARHSRRKGGSSWNSNCVPTQPSPPWATWPLDQQGRTRPALHRARRRHGREHLPYICRASRALGRCSDAQGTQAPALPRPMGGDIDILAAYPCDENGRKLAVGTHVALEVAEQRLTKKIEGGVMGSRMLDDQLHITQLAGSSRQRRRRSHLRPGLRHLPWRYLPCAQRLEQRHAKDRRRRYRARIRLL